MNEIIETGEERAARGRLTILGTRGIPAHHGGFETLAERLALFFASRGWNVNVACQAPPGVKRSRRIWQGVELESYPVPFRGSLGSIMFDFQSALSASRRGGVVLTLGYNTAVFGIIHRLRRRPHVLNLDGLEWKRAKWSLPARLWFYANERITPLVASALIADHPEIFRRFRGRSPARKLTMIPYGADRIREGDIRVLAVNGLRPNDYVLVVARPEPENSLLEIVSAFSRRPRGRRLVVLGAYDRAKKYHRLVMDSASPEVKFLGAIYDAHTVQTLRFFARLYIHGHQVGGTNPSLVEALGAGNAVIAHGNRFNRWVAGPHMGYFSDRDTCDRLLDELLENGEWLAQARRSALERHAEDFTWDRVLGQYEALLLATSQKANRMKMTVPSTFRRLLPMRPKPALGGERRAGTMDLREPSETPASGDHR